MKLFLKTPAKINLGLSILFKRDDGYHELETLFQMVGLYDEMEMENLASGIELHCDHPGIPNDESNLVWQAARLLQETFPGRVKSGARIKLTKAIPVGAGLGGGSGNAAGALMGLNTLWDLGLTRRDLQELAPKLGADVAFFLSSPCALGRGRGERLTPIRPAKKFHVILIYPRFPVAASWAYENLNLKLTKTQNNISILEKFLAQSDISHVGASLHNDLEPVVIKRFPEIQALKDQLRASGAEGTLMSGSGSAVFGIFDNLETAEDAFASLDKDNRDIFLTETINSVSEFLPEEIVNYTRAT